jgi:transposase-like protein
VTKTNALESLVIAGYIRGLSDALSKSTVSRVCEAIKTEFTTWNQRSLTEVGLDAD